MEVPMRKETTIEFTVTCYAAPLQIEGTISNDHGEFRAFYFRNRNDTIYCVMGEWTDMIPEKELHVWPLLEAENNPFSVRQRLRTDENGFAKEVSLKEALGFIMMTHELSL
jgi:hypothetical protein